ncbi:helix-turn-helix domain-containing protein [Jutongia huaianensis]|jgi:transcriptional regulator with XRE-family HTH domain|uniref:helix-turn-helix domain-containing protein n=1 Tax=Jutongia huaianensis TaxID=2763668 RepID=UPI000A4E506E
MNQIKIGKFIASCRKEQGMTQANLAEKLGITDRAVSKWENGKSMPDSGIMLELCELLEINVNELLSGEKIDMNNYEEKTEENLRQVLNRVEKILNENRVLKLAITILLIIIAMFVAFEFGEDIGRFIYTIFH